MKNIDERIEAYEKAVKAYHELKLKMQQSDEKQGQLIKLLQKKRHENRERNRVKLMTIAYKLGRKARDIEYESCRPVTHIID